MSRITTKIGDILIDSQALVICHQVNCLGVFRSELSKRIKERYPEVYQEYKHCVDVLERNCLGGCLLSETKNKKVYIANLFGQFQYQISKDLKGDKYITDLCKEFWQLPQVNTYNIPIRFTDYQAIYKSLERVKEEIESLIEDLELNPSNVKIAFPINFGCEPEEGGNWNIVRTMIEEVFLTEKYEIEIWKKS